MQRLNTELCSLLDHIGVVNTNNLCDGCMVGVLSVLGSRRFSALQDSETKCRFHCLIQSWQRTIQELTKEDSSGLVSADSDVAAQLMRSQALLERYGPCSAVGSSIVASTSSTLTPVDRAAKQLISASNAAATADAKIEHTMNCDICTDILYK